MPSWWDRLTGRQPFNAVVGSARELKVRGDGPRPSKERGWQGSAFDLYDQLGEVHNAFTLYGNGLSRAKVFPAWRLSPDQDPVPVADAVGEDGGPSEPLARRIEEEWLRLDSQADGAGMANQGGVRGLVSEFALHLGLAGETVLYGRETDDGGEAFEALSVSELSQRGSKWVVRRTPGGKGEEIADDDSTLLLRIWKPHPRWSDLPDSSLRPILDEGELLLLIQAGDLALAKSRIGNAGILYVDQSFELDPADPQDADGEPIGSRFVEELVEEAIAPLANPASASAVVPLIITGQGELGDRIKHITLERPLDEQTLERARWAVRRLARSVDLPPELILGLEDVNHWNAWMVDDQTAKLYLAPPLQNICEALGGGWLRPAVGAESDPDLARRLTAWYDLTDLIVRPDRSEQALRAYEQMALSNSALLRELGFDEADAPDDDELELRLLIRAAIVIAQGTGRAPDVGDTDELDAGRVPAPEGAAAAVLEAVASMRNGRTRALPDGTAEALAQVAGAPAEAVDRATNGRPSVTAAAPDRLAGLSDSLLSIDRTLYDRLEGAVDQAARRTLERAGARLRTRARPDRALSEAVSSVDDQHVAATLGRTIVSGFGVGEQELVEDGFDGLRDRFDRWVADAQAASLAEVQEAVEQEVDDVRLRLVERQQDEDREEAWRWFRDALIAWAVALLWAPDRDPDDGEFDPSVRVPFEVVREAVARAGGAATGGAGLVRDATQALRARGVATGVRVLNLLGGLGVTERALQWDYRPGIPRQPFAPHRSLHGRQFAGPDDDGLTNASTFPAGSHYRPGDHRGCRCVWRPVLAEDG